MHNDKGATSTTLLLTMPITKFCHDWILTYRFFRKCKTCSKVRIYTKQPSERGIQTIYTPLCRHWWREFVRIL